MQQLVPFIASRKNQIVFWFKVFYAAIVAVLIVGGYAIIQKNEWYGFFYNLGLQSGQAAIVFFVITLTPGICRRFKIIHPIPSVIQILRRYFGISVFMLALLHGMFMRVLDRLAGVLPLFSMVPLFEFFGLLSLFLLLFLFLTSNNFSTYHLGSWWGRLHKLVYLIAWLVFGHVFLQDPYSIWSILIGFTAMLEVVSYLVYFSRRNAAPVTPPSP